MPLDDVEFGPSDGLWDLVAVAHDRATARLTEPAGWVIVLSERERRDGEPPEPDWGNPYARFDTESCATVEAARERAHALLAPGGAWRAAVIWREAERVLIEAQDAETDSLAGRFAAPIQTRRRRLGRSETTLGDVEFPDPVPPLRAPTWNGTTWTLRAGDRVVAELRVTSTNWQFLLADVTPLPGLETVLPDSPYRHPPVGEWSLHQPDGTRVHALQLELNRSQAGWTWEGAFSA
ncbi:hypothetical protein OJ998_02625 [Solirubrobacter taibaiensis]|nr:hypothetical protein [Solirubrobacter taibaiensis]